MKKLLLNIPRGLTVAVFSYIIDSVVKKGTVALG